MFTFIDVNVLANYIFDYQSGGGNCYAPLFSDAVAASQINRRLVILDATGIMPMIIHLLIAWSETRLYMMMGMSWFIFLYRW